ncbi:MAG: anthranilate synthase component I [Candidatus Omnitrophica bacterium]|nr:anthranilate synthase component I [Candidatus Omnitrophota bacterium]
MYYPTKRDFVKLAKKGNVIPVYREVLADFDTPLSAFLKIDEGEYSYLLESVEGGEHMARYSFLGSSPALVISSKGRDVTVTRSGKTTCVTAARDPLDEVKKIMSGFEYVPVRGLPRFAGGLVGYMGYDMVRFFEKIPDKNPEELDMPDMQFMLTDTILIFDHVDHKIKVVSNALIDGDPSRCYDAAQRKVEKLIKKLKGSVPRGKVRTRRWRKSVISSNFSKKDFCGMVEKAKEYIRSGDIIQAVLSQRFRRKTHADAFEIYRALRSVNPSPYMFFLKLGRDRMIGSSPEILVRCEDGNVELRPIAGTRPRGATPEEDALLARELLADPKERAEHIMLVDLGRNDIGRVSDFGTVKAPEVMRLERYSHVMHIVSDVTGRLSKDRDAFDLIRATFPAGTVSGAPKVRAMELIDQFENTRRGPYAGSVGYISFSGNLDLCITIRTILMRGDMAFVQAGGGIVLDSVPEKEYQETVNKAKALMKAIEYAEEGLE